MILHDEGSKIFPQKCEKCDDIRVFTVQKPIDGKWFANCDTCGHMIKVEQHPENS